jgi:hypothetical protein
MNSAGKIFNVGVQRFRVHRSGLSFFVELATGFKAPGLYGKNQRFGFALNPEPLNLEPLNGCSLNIQPFDDHFEQEKRT